MAILQYTITPNDNPVWSGTFVINTLTGLIKNELPTQITSPNFNFVPAQVAVFGDYITWRSVDISANPPGPPDFLNIYPRDGYSVDIWCPQLIADANANRNWNFLVNKTYSLTLNKNTLTYSYNPPYPGNYGSGGLISFAVV
jgi:hypothetical protein